MESLVWNARFGSFDRGWFDNELNKLLDTVSRQDLETMDRDGRTALHWAAANGRHDVVIALLERGADVHAKCKYVGQTALHFASRWGHGGTVAVLLERGASAGEKDAFRLARHRWRWRRRGAMGMCTVRSGDRLGPPYM
eukprot:CAMPEP_0114135676 /NCGR_PEP_ID=MMETSP0043_2-20121206/14816_1 /TAXON_ID=464988 /ORGANISM="Hemiselmis andersenii, Strain CCMP644" /LENGTH=138 /DNA_ID=CAMNT_0001229395 /DNA_START=265 /DNA_END=681 /DNA_ORIENTATION=-